MPGLSNEQFENTDEWAHGSHLFDPEPFNSPEKHPGDLPFDEWVDLPNQVFHSTFVAEHALKDSPTIHAGTREAAEQLLNNRAYRYFGGIGSDQLSHVQTSSVVKPHTVPLSDDQVHDAMLTAFPETDSYTAVNKASRSAGTGDMGEAARDYKRLAVASSGRLDRGRIMARRLVGDVYPKTMSDSDANTADFILRTQGMQNRATPSIANSAGNLFMFQNEPEGQNIVSALKGGTSLEYRNNEEDPGSLSYVIPNWTENTRGYWDDVIDSPNQSDWSKNMARVKKEHGVEPEVAFTRKNIGKPVQVQPNLFGTEADTPDSREAGQPDARGARHIFAFDPERKS